MDSVTIICPEGQVHRFNAESGEEISVPCEWSKKIRSNVEECLACKKSWWDRENCAGNCTSHVEGINWMQMMRQ